MKKLKFTPHYLQKYRPRVCKYYALFCQISQNQNYILLVFAGRSFGYVQEICSGPECSLGGELSVQR